MDLMVKDRGASLCAMDYRLVFTATPVAHNMYWLTLFFMFYAWYLKILYRQRSYDCTGRDICLSDGLYNPHGRCNMYAAVPHGCSWNNMASLRRPRSPGFTAIIIIAVTVPHWSCDYHLYLLNFWCIDYFFGWLAGAAVASAAAAIANNHDHSKYYVSIHPHA